VTATPDRALLVTRIAAIGVAIGAVVSPPVANVFAGVMLIAFFFVADVRERLHAAAVSRIAKGVVIFAAALLLATLVAAFNPQGIKVALPHLFGWRTLLLMLIAFMVFDAEEWKVRLAVAFVVFASIGAIVSLIAWKVGWQYNKELEPGVVLRNTVTQAMAFAIAAFLAGVLLATRSVTARPGQLLLGAAILLLLGLLVFLQTGRSGQLMLLVLIVVAAAVLLRGPRRAFVIAAVPVLALVAINVSPVMQARFHQAWNELNSAAQGTEYSSMGIRVVMWQNTAELIKARPIVGYGLGGMRPAYEAYVKNSAATGWQATVTGDPHNQYLAVWVDAGLPGLLAFLFMLAAVALQPAPAPWRAVAVALLLAWCATSMASSHFQTFNEGHLIAILLGAFLAPSGVRESEPQAAASTAATAALTSS